MTFLILVPSSKAVHNTGKGIFDSEMFVNLVTVQKI